MKGRRSASASRRPARFTADLSGKLTRQHQLQSRRDLSGILSVYRRLRLVRRPGPACPARPGRTELQRGGEHAGRQRLPVPQPVRQCDPGERRHRPGQSGLFVGSCELCRPGQLVLREELLAGGHQPVRGRRFDHRQHRAAPAGRRRPVRRRRAVSEREIFDPIRVEQQPRAEPVPGVAGDGDVDPMSTEYGGRREPTGHRRARLPRYQRQRSREC